MGQRPGVFTYSQAVGAEVENIGAAESAKLPQKFLLEHWKGILAHCFTENDAFIKGEGACIMCKDPICHVDEREPDLSSGGISCQAYSMQRNKKGNTLSTGPIDTHPKHYTASEEFYKYLDVRNPKGWTVENTDAWDQINPKTGKTFMAEFAEEAAKRGRGYAVRAIITEHNVWVRMKRQRIIMFGIGDILGGNEAADWIFDAINAVTEYRLQTPPTSIWQLVDPDSTEEVASRNRGKETYVQAHTRECTAVSLIHAFLNQYSFSVFIWFLKIQF